MLTRTGVIPGQGRDVPRGGFTVKKFLRRSCGCRFVLALTALGGSGQVVDGALTYSAAAGEVNHVTVSVSGGKLLIDDPTGALTAPMVVNGSRSGAGVEPTEPWVARPHWF
jgi:hypothetical protein